jgi:hypothetical protein
MLTLRPSKIDHTSEPVGISNAAIFDSRTKIGYYNYMKSVFFILGLSVLMLTAGCAELQGKSVKTYQLQYDDAVQASTGALEDLEMSILNVEADWKLSGWIEILPVSPLAPAPGWTATCREMF